MLKRFVLSAALAALFVGCGGGEVMPGVGPFEPDGEYVYDIRLPLEYDFEEDYQLVIAFHDGGESERQVLDWWDRGLLERPDFILLALRAPFFGTSGYSWLPRDADPGSDTDRVAAARTAEDLVYTALDEVIAEYSVDEEDLILCGNGSGAGIALWMALTDPGLFDGLALFGSAGVPGWVPGVKEDNAGHLDVFLGTTAAARAGADATAERLRSVGARVEVHVADRGEAAGADGLRAMERFYSLAFPASSDLPPDDTDTMP